VACTLYPGASRSIELRLCLIIWPRLFSRRGSSLSIRGFYRPFRVESGASPKRSIRTARCLSSAPKTPLKTAAPPAETISTDGECADCSSGITCPFDICSTIPKATVARALARDIKVLLLDEPYEGLAPVIVQEIAKTLKIIRDQGITTIIVEQNAVAALKLADRAVILDTGTVVFDGDAKEVLEDEELRAKYLAI